MFVGRSICGKQVESVYRPTYTKRKEAETIQPVAVEPNYQIY